MRGRRRHSGSQLLGEAREEPARIHGLAVRAVALATQMGL